MSSNLQNLFSSPSPTGATGTVHNSFAGQGDEHERAEPHTITGGLHAGSHPPNNPAFSFRPSAQQGDIAGGSSAPPVSPEMWFLQEQERLKAEYMRQVQEHKQSAARTLSYDYTEPSNPTFSFRPVHDTAMLREVHPHHRLVRRCGSFRNKSASKLNT